MPVDGDTYDMPAIIETAEIRRSVHGLPQAKVRPPRKVRQRPGEARRLLGRHARRQGQGHPAVSDPVRRRHPDTTAQAQRLHNVLKEAGRPQPLFGARDTNHSKLNDDLGLPDDPATKALDEFVAEQLKR